MNLHHLKYFLDAASEGSLSRAAKQNLVSQSAVSRAIASLELELGVELVLHRQNRFQLTEAGVAVLADCRRVLESASRLKLAASDRAKSLHGPLRVAANQAIVSKLIGPLLPKLAAKHPAIVPELRIGNTDQVQEMLDRQEVDFGIVVQDGEVERRFQAGKICEGEFVVVRKPGLAVSRVPDGIIVSRTRSGGLSERYARGFERAYGTPFAPKLVVPSWQAIMDLAISGYGCALVPRFLCRDELKAKRLELLNHRVKSIPFELCTIVSRGRAMPRNAQALLELFPARC